MKYRIDYTDYVKHKGKILYRIVALKDINQLVKSGDLGGYIESTRNLSYHGKSWIHKGARVYGNLQIFSNVQVYGPVRELK